MKLPLDVPASAGRPFIALAWEIAVTILRTVEAGWRHALSFPEVNAASGEVTITERLRDGMRQALNSGEFDWSESMVVLDGSESRSRPDILVPDGRTDIPILVIEIFQRMKVHNPHAIIECKRIAGDDRHLCREYVVEGIDRFRLGKYGGNHSTGFMIGYLIADNADSAVKGIDRYLDRKSREAERLEPSTIAAVCWAWRSDHPRTGRSPIELHHAFLSFTKPQHARGR